MPKPAERRNPGMRKIPHSTVPAWVLLLLLSVSFSSYGLPSDANRPIVAAIKRRPHVLMQTDMSPDTFVISPRSHTEARVWRLTIHFLSFLIVIGGERRGSRGVEMAASCSIGGASNINLFGFQSKVKEFSSSSLAIPYKTRCTRLESPYWLKGIQTKHETAAAIYSKKPYHLRNLFVASCALSSMKNGLDVEEEKSTAKHISPSSPEVESLLTTICDTTSIAEFKMNIAGFQLYVKRNLVENNVPPPFQSLPAIHTSSSGPIPETNGSATTSVAITKPKASESMQTILDTASDEGLVILKSPKVGFFRRCRTIKGKKAPPSCKEKQEVKEGKVLCYIEQLGGQIPIESDVSGEVVKILRRDGEPIGYGDALISILPSFPGIKKLQQAAT